MSRRYSRCRSTAEEVLCTAKLGLTNARVPPATEHNVGQALDGYSRDSRLSTYSVDL